jgi:hypothetical protein
MRLENQIRSFLPFVKLSNEEIVFNEMAFAIRGHKGKTFEAEKLELLSGILYRNCYCKKFAKKNKIDFLNSTRPKNEQTQIKEDFYHSLQTANKSESTWLSGWVFQQKDAQGNCIVKKDNQVRLVKTEQIKPAHGIHKIEKDVLVSIKTEREKKTSENGFYFAFSSASFETTELIRLYWNVSEKLAPFLMEKLTTYLNRFEIPFQFKCLVNPFDYYRSDAAVLYIERRHFKLIRDMIDIYFADILPGLKNETPLFTKRLSKGLAFAECPLNGESFGMNRCRILSYAIIKNYRDKSPNPNFLNLVLDELERWGISRHKPFLNNNCKYTYQFNL